MDGHTAWLADYLEIRPENRERIKKYIKHGRILMGDWFVMPDELLLSGESLVRNLLLGYTICEDFGGEPMIVGDVIDVFGHISQLPQIFKNFGMEGALLHRGTSGEGENSEMMWEGADGSEILIIKVYPHLGYGDILALSEAKKDELAGVVKDYEKKKSAFGTTNILFGLDGNDHTSARWDLPELLEELNGLFENTELIHGNFNDYFLELKCALHTQYGSEWGKSLKRFKGELRTPSKFGLFNETITGTASSRVDLKQENDKSEILLSRYAEPLHAWSRLTGGNCQKPFLDLAWKHLFYNHPHDSIVGCSIDEVHRDMYYNFRQANALSINSIRESIQQICSNIDTSAFSGCAKTVTVFNLSNACKAVNECAFEIPSEEVYELEAKRLVPVINDENGDTPTQQLLRVEKRTRTEYLTGIRFTPSPNYTRHPPKGMRVHRYHTLIENEIPALSHKTYGIKYIDASKIPPPKDRLNVDGTCNIFDNGLLRVKINDNGLVDLRDMETNTDYYGLIRYSDCGDAGNGWYHIRPLKDKVISSLSVENWKNVSVEVAEKGALRAVFKISGDFMIPEKLDEERKNRISEIGIKITNYLTLTAGEKRLDCRTVIDNTAGQHRLQVMFPVSENLQKEDCFFADTAFDCLKRKIKGIDTTGWVEEYRPEAPFKNFVGITGETGGYNGLAVITKGICEGYVMDNADRTIALTLYRSFTQNLEAIDSVDSLLMEELTFEYAVVPLKPDDHVGIKMFTETEKYKYFPLYYTSKIKNKEDKGSDTDIQSSCFMEIDKNLVISTIKAAEKSDGIILRLFNPADREITANIKPYFDFDHVYERDMRECLVRKLSLNSDKTLQISMRGKQVITLSFD
jgi:alpha-mannosidase/mannosylglycerate hydrolase